MRMQLFAIDEVRVRNFVRGVQEATERRDAARWQIVYQTILAFRPRPSLGFTTRSEEPYTRLSYYTGPSRGFRDLSPDEVPSFDEPRIQWMLRLLVLEVPVYLLEGRMDRFSFMFCETLPDEVPIETPSDRAAFEMYRDELLDAPDERMPAAMAFLKGDPRQAYVGPADVSRFAETERAGGFLGRMAERLGGMAGQEVLRLRSFIDFVETEGCAIYFHEPPT
jgi:hypothetical protein